jgi:hypothetical protein
MMVVMRATLRSLSLEPEPSTLPAHESGFAFNARLVVGPADGPGEESFDVTVCSPAWLAERCRAEGIIDGLHHVVVTAASFDQRVLRTWFEARVNAVEGGDWATVADQLGRLGSWEFEGYRP